MAKILIFWKNIKTFLYANIINLPVIFENEKNDKEVEQIIGMCYIIDKKYLIVAKGENNMKCYVLKEGQKLIMDNLKKEEVSPEIEKIINDICSRWQVRNLSQKNKRSLYAYTDDYESEKIYEPIDPENLVISNGKVVGYYSNHFDAQRLVGFTGDETKVRLGDYDYSDYSNGTGKVDRGHVDMVHRPDDDTNPYADQPRFHSQEEYDDYIKWRD